MSRDFLKSPSIPPHMPYEESESLFDLLGPFDWERAQMYVEEGWIRGKPTVPRTLGKNKTDDYYYDSPVGYVEGISGGGLTRRVKPRYVEGMYRKMVSEPSGGRKFSRLPLKKMH